MNVSFDLVFEFIVNLMQGLILAIFIYNYLTPKFTKKMNILCCVRNALLMFLSVTLINYFGGIYSSFEALTFLLVMLGYSVFCFKDKLLLRIVAPFIEYISVSCLSVLFQALTTSILRKDTVYISYGGNIFYRIFLCALVNISLVLLLWLIYKYHKKTINIKDVKEVLIFIAFPVIVIFVIVLLSVVYFDSDLTYSSRVYIAVSMGLMICITIIMLIVLTKISKLNELRIQNIIMQNKEKMYKSEMEHSNRYIKEVSKIKHDINNEILCIRELLDKNNISEAISVCNSVTDNLEKVTNTLNTNNLYLNSIMNVVFKKARENNIKVKTKISNSLEDVEGNDIIVIFGNICDNAIEYLKDKTNKKLNVSITKKANMDIINISNSIESSVLKNNPDLLSSKNDSMHGYGIKNVKKAISKYNGEINFYEQGNMFYTNIILE